MDTNNAEALRAWLMACPPIADSPGIFGSDYLADEPGGYTLDSVPSALKYRENILGEMPLQTNQEQLFVLAARMDYGADVAANLANLMDFQEIFRWITEQSNAHELPEWSGGRLTAIIPTLTAYPISMGTDAARYQIQLKALYKAG